MWQQLRQIGEEPTSSAGAATVLVQPSVIQWVDGAVLPHFLTETRKTDFNRESFGFQKTAKNSTG